MKHKYSIVLLNALPDKKIKSLGNKCLIPVSKKLYLIDYQIKLLNHIFKSPEIIIIGSFDSKKLKKYIENTFTSKNIKYVEHEIGSTTNIGASIKAGMSEVSHTNCWLINSSIVFHKNITENLKKNLNKSFVVTHNAKGNIGYIVDNHQFLTHCYYDLPNTILDSLYISSNDFQTFNSIIDKDITKLYMFEIINLCLTNNIKIKSIPIPTKSVHYIDSMNSIELLKKKICII